MKIIEERPRPTVAPSFPVKVSEDVVGYIFWRGDEDHQAYDADGVSLGVFGSQARAIGALLRPVLTTRSS
jgi:hypothetical protein